MKKREKLVLEDEKEILDSIKSKKGSSNQQKGSKYSNKKGGSQPGSNHGGNMPAYVHGQSQALNQGQGSNFNSNHSGTHQFNSLNYAHTNIPPQKFASIGGHPPPNYVYYSNPGMSHQMQNHNQHQIPRYNLTQNHPMHQAPILNSTNFDIEDIINKEYINQSKKRTAESENEVILNQGKYGTIFNSNQSGLGSNNSGSNFQINKMFFSNQQEQHHAQNRQAPHADHSINNAEQNDNFEAKNKKKDIVKGKEQGLAKLVSDLTNNRNANSSNNKFSIF